MRKLGRKRQRAAAKAPLWLRSIAAANFDPKGEAEYQTKKLGTFGPASEVRYIDPQDYPHSSLTPRAMDKPAGSTHLLPRQPAGAESQQVSL